MPVNASAQVYVVGFLLWWSVWEVLPLNHFSPQYTCANEHMKPKKNLVKFGKEITGEESFVHSKFSELNRSEVSFFHI